jgi:hypothetical protein
MKVLFFLIFLVFGAAQTLQLTWRGSQLIQTDGVYTIFQAPPILASPTAFTVSGVSITVQTGGDWTQGQFSIDIWDLTTVNLIGQGTPFSPADVNVLVTSLPSPASPATITPTVTFLDTRPAGAYVGPGNSIALFISSVAGSTWSGTVNVTAVSIYGQ